MSSLELRAAVSHVHAVAAELQAHHDSGQAAGCVDNARFYCVNRFLAA